MSGVDLVFLKSYGNWKFLAIPIRDAYIQRLQAALAKVRESLFAPVFN